METLCRCKLKLSHKFPTVQQWGNVAAGDFALPISFISKYSAVACDTGSANAAIRVSKKSNSIVNFYGRDYSGNGYETPSVTFIAVGV